MNKILIILLFQTCFSFSCNNIFGAKRSPLALDEITQKIIQAHPDSTQGLLIDFLKNNLDIKDRSPKKPIKIFTKPPSIKHPVTKDQVQIFIDHVLIAQKYLSQYSNPIWLNNHYYVHFLTDQNLNSKYPHFSLKNTKLVMKTLKNYLDRTNMIRFIKRHPNFLTIVLLYNAPMLKKNLNFLNKYLTKSQVTKIIHNRQLLFLLDDQTFSENIKTLAQKNTEKEIFDTLMDPDFKLHYFNSL